MMSKCMSRMLLNADRASFVLMSQQGSPGLARWLQEVLANSRDHRVVEDERVPEPNRDERGQDRDESMNNTCVTLSAKLNSGR